MSDQPIHPEELLHGLQHEMQRYLKRVAPLPLADTRLLYQDLLARAQAAAKLDS